MEKDTLYKLIADAGIMPGDRVLIGLSGGADSVALFHLLAAYKKSVDFELTAIHIHHGIRGEEADRDAAFVEELCEKCGVELVLERADIPALARSLGISEELAGRNVRHSVFAREAELRSAYGTVRLFLAHHANDQEETILMNFLRGSGIAGLSGMKRVQERCIGAAKYYVYRPLLEVTHGEIVDFLKENEYKWCEDCTNSEIIYTRNAIRLSILPGIKELYPGFTQVALRNAELAAEVSEYMRLQAEEFLKKNSVTADGEISVDVQALSAAHHALAKEVVRLALEECGGLVDISMAHTDEIMALLKSQSGRRVIIGDRTIRRSYGQLVFGSYVPEHEEEISAELTTLSVSEVKRLINENGAFVKWFDYDKLNIGSLDELVIRYPLPGDQLIIDREGHKKKLSSYFKNEKIPQSRRDKIKVVAIGSTVLWVVGYRDSCGFEIDDKTTRIVKISRRVL